MNPRRPLNVTTAEVLDIFRGAPCIRGTVTLPFEGMEPDSITLVELVMEAEKRLGVEIPDNVFIGERTVGLMAKAVAEFVTSRYDGREPHHHAPHRFERHG